MNREILKSMDTGHIPVQRLTALLESKRFIIGRIVRLQLL